MEGEVARSQDSSIISCSFFFSFPDISTPMIAILTSVIELLYCSLMHMLFLAARKVEKGEGSGNRGRREKD